MALKTLYEELEEVVTHRLKNAYRTGEEINAPDWVDDLAHATALMIGIVEPKDFTRLRAFAHEKLDHWIDAVRAEFRSSG